VLLGEVHGSYETPGFVGDLVCHAATAGTVRVGLEMPPEEQERIDAFLHSDGSPTDRQQMLAGAFWTRDDQDGRISVAMLALLDSLRQLSRGGANLKVVAFDIRQDRRDVDRDQEMAKNLAAAFEREPTAIFIVLVGNLHARKEPHPDFPQPFMAEYFVRMRIRLTTLDVRYGAGTSWICCPECGAHVVGHERALSRDRAYDGTFSVGVLTAASPAARP
jgi:hypothetical protein